MLSVTACWLAILSSLHMASGACLQRLDVVENNSSFTVTGFGFTNTTGARPSLGLVHANATTGLAGSSFLSLPNLPQCPSTIQGWSSALSVQALLTSSTDAFSADQLSLFPTTLQTAAAPAGVDFVGITLDFVASSSVAIAADPLTLNFTVNASTSSGYSYTPTSTAIQPFTTATYTNTSTATVTFKEEDGLLMLYLTFPSIYLRLSGSVNTSSTTTITQGAVDLVLSGALQLRGAANCSRDCGAHGRCTAAGGAQACECECGWAADAQGACTIASGYCPRFPTQASSPTSGRSTSSSSSSSCTISSSDGTCPAGFGYYISPKNCQLCSSGFDGPACKLCKTNGACRDQLGSLTAECGSGLAYSRHSKLKHYSCKLTNPGLAAILSSNILAFSCDTQGSNMEMPGSTSNASAAASISASPVGGAGASVLGRTPFCALELRLGSMPAGQTIMCRAWDCKFAAGGGDVMCNSVDCSCPNGCKEASTGGADWEPTAKGIAGNVNLKCDALSGDCGLSLGSLGIPVDMKCEATECLDPAGDAVLSGGGVAAQSERLWVAPLVAAIPLALLLAACAVMVATMHSARELLRPGAGRATAPSKAGPVAEASETRANGALALPDVSGIAGSPGTAAVGDLLGCKQQLAQQHAVSEIRFVGITCSVRQRPSWLEALLHQRQALEQHDMESAPDQQPQRKRILHGISGTARCGEVMGILGPSGGGKSTLLSILTGQTASDADWTLGGSITVDSQPAAAEALSRLTAFVPQDDFILRSLTVDECLTYSAALRLANATPAELRQRVDATLAELNLLHVRDSLVWAGTGSTPGVSGGERRRVSIAMELVTGPGVVVLDEPTSGLDSHSALQLMRTLKGVAAQGRLVVMSLHQPGPAIFNLLDRTLLLAKGRAVYYGAPADAPAAFERLGVPCPADSTIAEHMLHVVSDGQLWPVVAAQLKLQQQEEEQQQGEQQLLKVARRGPGLLQELAVVFWRSCADVVRNPLLGTFHAVIGLVSGLLVGFIFFRVSNDTSGAQNRVGSAFFALCLLAFTSITSVDLVQSERQVVSREISRGYYSSLSYTISKLVLDGLVLRALPAVLFTVPFYWLMGLQPSAACFFNFLFAFAAFNCTVGALSLALSSLLSSAGKTILAMNVVLLLGVLFGGFLANKNVMPAALRWITYLSAFRYAWEALVVNELRGLFLYFSAPGVSLTVAVKGDIFLDVIGVDPALLTFNVGVLSAMYVGCCVFAVVGEWLQHARLRRRG